MSYLSQSQLETDAAFGDRCRAAITNQALIFKDDERGDIAALAEAMLRGEAPGTGTFVRTLAASPGFAATADNGDGTVNSSLISDDDILAAVQAEWPTVAALFYANDGGPPL